jgi:hypothetical protein
MDDVRFGVKATVIDLGLSRMETTDAQGSKTYWTPFDEEIFEGEGQCLTHPWDIRFADRYRQEITNLMSTG